jgi:hypothetical protein
MRPSIFFFITFCFVSIFVPAQYAPQAGINGSTAISASDNRLIEWANFCSIQRGWMDIADVSQGRVSQGDSSLAIGSADHTIVSLGDSGIAVLTFAAPIFNGPGPDFAVFENGFINAANPEEAFLELAFVEVSSDGIHFFRFPATSLTSDTFQIPGSGVYMNARLINNLAGKYAANFGTPFDLQELAGISGLDINHITHVRLVDVVGALTEHASHDKDGRIINDPYPTNFPTGGFDLDAVGVLHAVGLDVATIHQSVDVQVFPNPVSDIIRFANTALLGSDATASLYNTTGSLIAHISLHDTQEMSMTTLPTGVYYLYVQDSNGNTCIRQVTKL